MPAESAMVKPTNKIVVDSTNLHIQTKEVQTATNVYPGRLLKKGTDDGQVIVGDGSNPAVGWAGYEQTAKKYRPATVDTIYTVNSMIAMLNGPGIIIVGSLASGQNVSKGALLTVTTAGELTAATVGTHHVYAQAEESVNATGGSQDIMVRSLF